MVFFEENVEARAAAKKYVSEQGITNLWYIGSGPDASPILDFESENLNLLIYQDNMSELMFASVGGSIESLSKDNRIQDYPPPQIEKLHGATRTEFQYKVRGNEQRLIEYCGELCDAQEYIPPEIEALEKVHGGVDLIYTRLLDGPVESIKTVCVNVLPYLKVGGFLFDLDLLKARAPTVHAQGIVRRGDIQPSEFGFESIMKGLLIKKRKLNKTKYKSTLDAEKEKLEAFAAAKGLFLPEFFGPIKK